MMNVTMAVATILTVQQITAVITATTPLDNESVTKLISKTYQFSLNLFNAILHRKYYW